MSKFLRTLAIAATTIVLFSCAPSELRNSNSVTPETKPQLRLYGGSRTRSVMLQWYLAELNLPYEYVKLDIQAGDNLKPEYLAINPMGKLPAIADGKMKLWESGAILLYLANKYDKTTTSLETQAEIAQWVFFANATLGPGLFLENRRETEMPRLLKPLDGIFQKRPFLLGEKLTAADVAVGYYLYMGRLLLKLDYGEYPAVENYLENLSSRSPFRETVGKRSR